MLPLNSKDFPQSASDFERAVEEGLRRYVRKDGRIVTISARVFPYLDEVAMNLDGAQIDSSLLAPVSLAGETKHACEAAIVTMGARNVLIQGVPVSLRMEVRDVVFHQGKDAAGDAFLVVQKAREGHIVVSAEQLDLEKMIAEAARVQAAKNGVSIENVRLALRARGARSIAANVRLQAKKLLFRANIDIAGQLDITDDFVAKTSQLKCKGDGAIGSLACGVLEPHLQRLNGATFPLMSLPLGEIRLRDIRIAVADTVEITADFGTDDS
ncbi:MAG: hypothetical protein QOI22_2008 [Verrucomicrobiota bacterium]